VSPGQTKSFSTPTVGGPEREKEKSKTSPAGKKYTWPCAIKEKKKAGQSATAQHNSHQTRGDGPVDMWWKGKSEKRFALKGGRRLDRCGKRGGKKGAYPSLGSKRRRLTGMKDQKSHKNRGKRGQGTNRKEDIRPYLKKLDANGINCETGRI